MIRYSRGLKPTKQPLTTRPQTVKCKDLPGSINNLLKRFSLSMRHFQIFAIQRHLCQASRPAQSGSGRTQAASESGMRSITCSILLFPCSLKQTLNRLSPLSRIIFLDLAGPAIWREQVLGIPLPESAPKAGPGTPQFMRTNSASIQPPLGL